MEGAAAQLLTTNGPMNYIAEKFVAYESRIQTGRTIAVKWAGRLEFVGTLAAGVAAGPLRLVRSSLTAGAYTAGSQGLQQAASVATGQQDSMHWKELATTAGITTVMSLFGGAIQSKFKGAILARMGASSAVTVNVVDDWLSGVLASSTSTVYQLPMQMVLEGVAAGKAFPGSADELADMVVEEAIKNGTISMATDAITASSGHGGAHPDSAESLGAELMVREGGAAGPSKGAEPGTGKGVESSGEHSGSTHGGGEGNGGAEGHGGEHSATEDSVGGNKRPDASQSSDSRYESGLLSEASKKRLAHEALGAYEKLGLNDPKKALLTEHDIHQSVETIRKIVEAELASSKMPMPTVKVVRNQNVNSHGSYAKKTNTIEINSNSSKFRGPDGFQKLLGTIVHETRHVEQTFNALRVRAGEAPVGLDPHLVGSAIQAETDVDPKLAYAAADDPIRESDTSPEAELGREMWAEKFQAGPRKDLQDWAQKANASEADVRQKLEVLQDRAKNASGKAQPESLAARIAEIQAHLEAAYDHHYNLAGEIDARRVQSHVEGLFQAKLKLQQEVTSLTDSLRSAEADLQKPGAADTASLDALVTLLRRQNALRDALQNELGLMPTSLETPGAPTTSGTKTP